MKKDNFLKLSLMVVSFFVSGMLSAQTPSSGTPNIIYILADDWGIGDVKAYGGNSCKIDTPNMDKLAEDGMKFTDAHSSSAVCSPSRYSILTGRYNWRSELKSGVVGAYSSPIIKQGRETVASMLKKNGYATAAIGKWHVGMDIPTIDGINSPNASNTDWNGTIENGPNSLGFDYYWGTNTSQDNAPFIWIENDGFVGKCTVEKSFGGKSGPAHADFEAVDVLPTLTQKAVTFIAEKANAGENFFLYMPLNSPHTPHVPSPEFQGKSSLGTYGDFVMETDWSIGEVVKAVEDAGIADNTIIIVTSDNGTSPWSILGKNVYNNKLKFRTGTCEADDPALHYPSDIYRGMKADIYEGGHRVPFIVRWDGKVQAGSVENTTIGLVDLYATCAEIVGADIPDNVAEDSHSILPILLGSEFTPLREAEVHHSINGSFAIRQGKWKLVFCPGSGGWSNPLPPKTGPFFGYENIDPTALKDYEWVQLFDLEADPAETTNLSDQYPDKIKELTELAQKYIEDGRSTPGTKQQNDGEETLLYPKWTQAYKTPFTQIEYPTLIYTNRVLKKARHKNEDFLKGEPLGKFQIANEMVYECMQYIGKRFPEANGRIERYKKAEELVAKGDAGYLNFHKKTVTAINRIDSLIAAKNQTYKDLLTEFNKGMLPKFFHEGIETYDYLKDLSGPIRKQVKAPVNENEWSAFLEKSNLEFSSPLSEDWGKGLYIADGRTGALIRKNTSSEWGLRFELGKTDVATDNKPNKHWFTPARVPVGDIILKPEETVIHVQLKSDIWNGEALFSIETSEGKLSGVSFVNREYNTLVIITDGEPQIEVDFMGAHGITKWAKDNMADIDPADLPPLPLTEVTNGISLTLHPMVKNAAHVTACKKVTDGTKTYFYLAIDKVVDKNVSEALIKARTNAITKLEKAMVQGAETLRSDNQSWWHNYMRQAWVSIPDDPMWETWYWQQIYKFGAYTHADDVIAADLMGPWCTETNWPGCWWNLNYQLQYFPTFTANRLDVGRSLVTAMDGFYESGVLHHSKLTDAITIGRSTGYFPSSSNAGATQELGNLTWALHNYWKYWRYSMDEEIGRNCFKLLRANMNYYMGVMKLGEDGKYHLPNMKSPEYKNGKWQFWKNTTYSLASFRWGLNTVIAMNDELNMNDSLLSQWQYTLDNLTSTPVGINGYKIAQDQELENSHRHYSHLLDLYPYHTLHPDDGEDAEKLFEKSLIHWVSKTSMMAGYSHIGASAMFSVLGDGQNALHQLNNTFDAEYLQNLSTETGLLCNTFYHEGSNPVIETPFATVASIDYMLLQSMRGVIRVFPAVPEKWKNVSFSKLRTEGAFLVSAVRRDGKTQWIEIESLAGETCVLDTDMTSFSASIPDRITTINGPNAKNRYEIALKQGEMIKLTYKP